jgi:hypothetical protein
MNKYNGCLLVCCCLLSNISVAVELEYSTKARARWGINTRNGNTQSLNLSLQPELVLNFDSGIRLTAIARAHSDIIDKIAPGSLIRESYHPVSKPLLITHKLELELRELYIDAEWEETYFTIGKQQVVWGKADGLKVLDVVNPQSFREFILMGFDDSRIPQWTLKVERTLGPLDIEFLWLPDQTYHALPEPGSTYGLTSTRVVSAQPPAGVNVDFRSPQRPDRIIQDSDVGMRLTSFWKGWDLTFNYLYQYDNLPVFKQQLNQTTDNLIVTVTPQYKRTHVVGTTFSNAFDDWVLRGEIAWFSNRHFLTQSPFDHAGVISSPELFYVLGLDWSAPYDLFASAQLFQSWVIKPKNSMNRDKLDTTMSLLVSRPFLNDTLIVELLVLGNINDGDGMIRPKIEYQFNDELQVLLGADLFYGDSNGLFGQFTRNDRVVVGAEWFF